MARTLRNAKIDSRSARAKLAERREPYWTVVSAGCAIGYRRGAKGGSWIARFRDQDGQQHYGSLGAANDARDADAISVFSFSQAQEKARSVFTQKAREIAGDFVPSDGPFTVNDALDLYLAAYERRGGKSLTQMKSSIAANIRPVLGAILLSKLTKRKLQEWQEQLAKSPARVRVRKGAELRFRPADRTQEGIRRRRSTANRVLNMLKAALNHAFSEGKIAHDDAWKQVRAYREVDAARLRYLSGAEIHQLVNACAADFRALVTAGLMTGCRYSELASIIVEDFNADSGTVCIRVSKSGKPRHVALTDEGKEFFARAAVDCTSGALLFTKSDGGRWSKSDQQRPLAAACVAARVEGITFHGLRHTYSSRLAMKGVPLAVIAAQLGHADTRMVEKHYGHLAPNYVAETVRAAFGTLGINKPTKVLRLAAHPKR
jgi:integrase